MEKMNILAQQHRALCWTACVGSAKIQRQALQLLGENKAILTFGKD